MQTDLLRNDLTRLRRMRGIANCLVMLHRLHGYAIGALLCRLGRLHLLLLLMMLSRQLRRDIDDL